MSELRCLRSLRGGDGDDGGDDDGGGGGVLRRYGSPLRRWLRNVLWLGQLNHMNVQRLIGVTVAEYAVPASALAAAPSPPASAAAQRRRGRKVLVARAFAEPTLPYVAGGGSGLDGEGVGGVDSDDDGDEDSDERSLGSRDANKLGRRGRGRGLFGRPDSVRRRAQLSDGLAPEEACRLIRQLVAGVSYVHRCGVVHRNVTADNVLVNDRGTVKLAGFDSARKVDGLDDDDDDEEEGGEDEDEEDDEDDDEDYEGEDDDNDGHGDGRRVGSAGAAGAGSLNSAQHLSRDDGGIALSYMPPEVRLLSVWQLSHNTRVKHATTHHLALRARAALLTIASRTQICVLVLDTPSPRPTSLTTLSHPPTLIPSGACGGC